jgi:signal transduction histidine kinase
MIAFSLKKAGKLFYKTFEQGDCSFANCPLGKTEKIYCKKFNEERRRGIVIKKDYELYMCTNEEIDSSKIFKNKAEAVLEFAPLMLQIKDNLAHDNKVVIDRLTHNLKKYSAHCIQASENILDPYANTSGTKGQIESIKKNINNSIEKTTQSFLKIIKNNKLIQAELSVYDRLSKKELNKNIDKSHHSVHKLIRATLSAFWDSFMENNVKIELSECRKEIFIDYETFTVALVHITDNCTKYICPHNTLKITFSDVSKTQLKISFSMLSLRINEHEETKIFQLGYSGELSKELELNGSGTGMHIVKTFIELNNGVINCKINRAKTMKFNGVDYDDNTFEIIVPTE